MLLNNEFVVGAPVDRAWAILTDLEQVAACLPGASLEGREGDSYVGGVKIKVGPISAAFRGTARFVTQDDVGHSAEIAAAGRDPRGQSTANATIRARLEPDGPNRTRVLVDTDLDISGRMAQFGRGAMADVSARLMNQFADNLSARISSEEAAPVHSAVGDTARAPVTSVPRPVSAAAAAGPSGDAGLDALSLLGPVVVKRFGPGFLLLLVGVVVGRQLGVRSQRRRERTGWRECP